MIWGAVKIKLDCWFNGHVWWLDGLGNPPPLIIFCKRCDKIYNPERDKL